MQLPRRSGERCYPQGHGRMIDYLKFALLLICFYLGIKHL